MHACRSCYVSWCISLRVNDREMQKSIPFQASEPSCREDQDDRPARDLCRYCITGAVQNRVLKHCPREPHKSSGLRNSRNNKAVANTDNHNQNDYL